MNGPLQVIDPADSRIDVFRDVRDRDLRGRDGLFMGESELVLERLLATPDRLHSLLLSPQRFDRLEPQLRSLPDSIPVYTAEIEIMGAISGFHIHRGVLVAGKRPEAGELQLDHALGHLRPVGSEDQQQCTILLAEGITNVDNIGSLFRNAAAMGVDGIVLDPTCCDPLYRKSVRVSMGHVFSIAWAEGGDDHAAWIESIHRIRDEWGCTVIGAESGQSAVQPWEVTWPHRCALLVGAERSGLSKEAVEACDQLVEIPMTGAVPSINVALAAGICLYERMRVSS